MAAVSTRRDRRKPVGKTKLQAAQSPIRRDSTISRWGTSLGLRIPQEAVDRLKLLPGAHVSLEVSADSITIRAVRKAKKWTELQLLKGVTPEMVGGEVDWGGPVGKEVW